MTVPDVRVTIEDLFAADGDRVVARLTISGTHTGARLQGCLRAGTGSSTARSASTTSPTAKIDQTWAMQDRLALAEQLGAVRPAAPVDWARGVRAPAAEAPDTLPEWRRSRGRSARRSSTRSARRCAGRPCRRSASMGTQRCG
ncbi:MAG: ester cyclase [Thermoleophilia bacterium]|nr:ester cyclase [Thermoleophilia bacterium]